MLFRPLLIGLLLSAGQAPAALEGSRPNIILVMTDDQGYGQIAALGHPWLKTPNLDKLHAQSTRFTRFMVAPTCSPTRSAIMTGRHPEKNGITHTINERDRMALAATTLPQVLKTVGYTTGIFGKWHLGDEADYQPEKRGFDEVFIHGSGGIGQAFKCSNADAPGNKYFDPTIRHNGRFEKTQGFCTDVFFRQALGWIQQQADAKKPFFAYLATNAPHGPFIAPPASRKRFEDLGFHSAPAGFYGMIENVDANIGLLLEKLDQWKLAENTVVIFMSDNGTTFWGTGNGRGEHLAQGYAVYNAGMKGFKNSTDEGGVRVPFFVRWPGRIKEGCDIGTLGAHIDILPTLAQLAGAQWPKDQVEGRSLLPLLEGRDGEWSDRFIFNHIGRWPVGAEPDDYKNVNYSVRNQRYRLVAGKRGQDSTDNKEDAAPALYDMDKDPEQKQDVSAQHPEVVAAMVAAYEKYWSEARPLMINEKAPMSPVKPYHEWHKKQLEEGGIPDWKAPEL